MPEPTCWTVAIDETAAAWNLLGWIDGEMSAGDRVELLTVHEHLGQTTERITGRLAIAARRLRHHHPDVQVEQSVVDGATVARLLADAAASDILVIGGRRSGQFWAAITGRIAERLVAHVTVPVVVVPEHWMPGEQAPVVMGVDGRTATAALAFAADRAERRGADLVLIRAWEPPTSISPFGRVYLARDSGRWEHESQLELDAAIRAVSAAHPDLRMRGELHQGTPADVLLRGEGTASMLVIGRRHRTAFGAFLTGSVGEELLHRGRSPVCVVPPVDHG